VNLLVDFLFMEILSAPTVDAMKIQEEENVMQKTVRRVSVVGNRVGKNVKMMGRRMSNVIAAVPSALSHQKSEELVKSSRLIPSATSDAHDIALASSKQILLSAQKENEQMRTRRQSESYQMTVHKQQNIRQARIEKAEKRQPRQGRSTDLSLENLFAELCVDIAEQRKQLPREVNEDFDDLWGYVPLLQSCSSTPV
jgi:hypothetical protein